MTLLKKPLSTAKNAEIAEKNLMITLRTPRSLTITMDAFGATMGAFGLDGFAVWLKILFFSGVDKALSNFYERIAAWH